MGPADRLRRLRRLACRDVVELVTDHLEGALGGNLRRRLEAHLAGCVACAAYLAQMRATVAALARLDRRDLPAATRAELTVLAALAGRSRSAPGGRPAGRG